MKFSVSKKILLISMPSLVFFILDRVLKYLAVAGKIFYHQNSGIAFSINIPENLFLYFYILVFLILLFIIWQLVSAIKKNSVWQLVGYELILLGAVSNLIDRIKFNHIIDYFNFGFFYNNLADVIVCLGVAILLLAIILKRKV